MKIILLTLLSGFLSIFNPNALVPPQPLSWTVMSSVSLISPTGKQAHLRSSPLTAFIMLSPECPLCKNYISVINQLHKKYPAVTVYGIIPGKAYTTKEVAQFQREFKPDFPLLIDPEKKLSRHLKATTTPESILINQTGELKYRGLIDNWAVSLGQQRQVTTEHYLATAIQSIKDNNEIIRSYTRPVGCKINDL